MDIEIVENKKQGLFVYKDYELLFYSKIESNWLKKNLIKIFDSNDDLILELQSYDSPFKPLKLKILSQNIAEIENISEISKSEIIFNENNKLTSQKVDFFALNQNYFYLFNGIKVDKIKQKMWNSPQKIILDIHEKEFKFSDMLIIHILAVRTGFNSNSG